MNFDKEKTRNKKEIIKLKKDFCHANNLVYRTFEQTVKEYRELRSEIKSKENFLNPELTKLLEKDDTLSAEKHEVKI